MAKFVIVCPVCGTEVARDEVARQEQSVRRHTENAVPD